MALDNVYNDAFLARLVTEDKECEASEYVDNIARFSDKWRGRLVVLRVYISICLDAQKGGTDDVYAVKLSSYRKEFDSLLAVARSEVVAGAVVSPIFPNLSASCGRY